MDEGPFRMPKPADRNVADKPEPDQQSAAEPQRVVKEGPKTVQRPTSTQQHVSDEKPLRRFVIPIVIAIAVVVVAAIGFAVWSGSQQGPAVTAIDSSKYQAVFFTNGQVYFGKLQPLSSDSLKLTDVYYLQTQSTDAASSKNPQATTSDQNNTTLIKLGNEIHGPEDAMIITKDQVLFYENLKPDGKVAKSIQQYKDSKK